MAAVLVNVTANWSGRIHRAALRNGTFETDCGLGIRAEIAVLHNIGPTCKHCKRVAR